jgi:hypothetical protein
MADTSPFAPFVPGFEFFQGLVNNAGAALPGIGKWVAPTLNPQELEKRISELRTVQFWLEQNTRMLAATIQALEVQRMTLSTLKTMNVQMDDLRDSLQMKPPQPAERSAPESAFSGFFANTSAPKPAAGTPSVFSSSSASTEPVEPPAATAPPPGVDPLQWWNALTQQFTQLATQAMQQSATDVSKHMTTSVAATPAKPSPAPKTNGSAPATKSRQTSPARKAIATKAPTRRAPIKPKN